MPIKKTESASLLKTPTPSRVQAKAKSVTKTTAKAKPLVAVIMGSSSDWDVMANAVAILEHFGIAFEAQVISAHRMPNDMVAFAAGASKRGLRAIIAGAGGAAHLPGMVAALTELPVFGVPVPSQYLRGKTRCCLSCRCPRAYPWPPLRLVRLVR